MSIVLKPNLFVASLPIFDFLAVSALPKVGKADNFQQSANSSKSGFDFMEYNAHPLLPTLSRPHPTATQPTRRTATLVAALNNAHAWAGKTVGVDAYAHSHAYGALDAEACTILCVTFRDRAASSAS
ncbi:hypothetical protein BJ138DRAFT_1120652 [Hygrophoropsis aurantiaca]|uniref:Uncharacterized protein n=1 Tax=Hygrophoropsis aurantiaca TaxID=72124 RepID=A0ACB7ZS48_9AGAM|nr:hypothetical protein BJ138DRAFT_1120652 [Hygrophoropsis aurantiaca]